MRCSIFVVPKKHTITSLQSLRISEFRLCAQLSRFNYMNPRFDSN